jgi:homoserine O-succinyltransferase
MMVFFQGHLEYTETTLLKEYRRDVDRFIHGRQPHHPTLPCGYFTAEGAAALDEFKARALAGSA